MNTEQLQPLNQWFPDLTSPLVIAGPCSAESETQVLQTARALSQLPEVRIFRAGIWKPRTRPNTFEGVGEAGLPWLKLARQETGLPVSTEVANARHVELALKYEIDVLWIGARTTASPFAVQEIAEALKGTDVPVLVKNPVNADLPLWLGALERLAVMGVRKLGAIHRGFSAYEPSKYRNLPLWKIPMELKRQFPDLPLICDPSHIAGERSLLYEIAQKALDLGMQGVMVETHPDPDHALSDAQQQVTPAGLQEIISNFEIRTPDVDNPGFQQELDGWRSQIDRIDQEILDALAHRMQVVHKIGETKIRHGVTALQVGRMDAIMQKQMKMAESAGLRPEYVQEIYRTVHEESVRTQTEMMRDAGHDLGK